MTRVLSGIQPTGEIHLGNYIGAVRHWATDQHEHDSLFCVVDLHALTIEHDPAGLQDKTLEVAAKEAEPVKTDDPGCWSAWRRSAS